jgi:SsrA-binding protein
MKIIANNKRAYFDYFISDQLEAGMVLEGSEVKSVRSGGISINESGKYEKAVSEKGLTIVPLRVYLKSNLVKIEIGIGKGKKLYDKRETLKEKTTQREIDMAMKKANK